MIRTSDMAQHCSADVTHDKDRDTSRVPLMVHRQMCESEHVMMLPCARQRPTIDVSSTHGRHQARVPPTYRVAVDAYGCDGRRMSAQLADVFARVEVPYDACLVLRQGVSVEAKDYQRPAVVTIHPSPRQ